MKLHDPEDQTILNAMDEQDASESSEYAHDQHICRVFLFRKEGSRAGHATESVLRVWWVGSASW